MDRSRPRCAWDHIQGNALDSSSTPHTFAWPAGEARRCLLLMRIPLRMTPLIPHHAQHRCRSSAPEPIPVELTFVIVSKNWGSALMLMCIYLPVGSIGLGWGVGGCGTKEPVVKEIERGMKVVWCGVVDGSCLGASRRLGPAAACHSSGGQN
jgi:hypothetical protein